MSTTTKMPSGGVGSTVVNCSATTNGATENLRVDDVVDGSQLIQCRMDSFGGETVGQWKRPLLVALALLP
jgi:hypothetical protein